MFAPKEFSYDGGNTSLWALIKPGYFEFNATPSDGRPFVRNTYDSVLREAALSVTPPQHPFLEYLALKATQVTTIVEPERIRISGRWSQLCEGITELSFSNSTENQFPGIFLGTGRTILTVNAEPAAVSSEGILFQTDEKVADDLGISLRELEILKATAKLDEIKDVADELGITVSTARTHLKNVGAKLKTRNKMQAVVKAIYAGLKVTE